MKVCTIDGCENEHRARGYCGVHYVAARRRGEIAVREGHPRQDDHSRVLRFVDQSSGPDACWVWQGARNLRGYGRTYLMVGDIRRDTSAHRAVYLLLGGEIPIGLHLLHSCDNPPCCNPAHLRPGTHAENMEDRHRSGLAKPSGHWSSRAVDVSDEMVAAIRSAYIPRVEGHTLRAVAADFGLDQAIVFNIVNRRGRWAEAA